MCLLNFLPTVDLTRGPWVLKGNDRCTSVQHYSYLLLFLVSGSGQSCLNLHISTISRPFYLRRGTINNHNHHTLFHPPFSLVALIIVPSILLQYPTNQQTLPYRNPTCCTPCFSDAVSSCYAQPAYLVIVIVIITNIHLINERNQSLSSSSPALVQHYLICPSSTINRQF